MKRSRSKEEVSVVMSNNNDKNNDDKNNNEYVCGVALGVREVPQVSRRSARHVCRNCARDVTAEPRMKCAVCPHFLLCLTCFSVGAELAPHRAHHDYVLFRSARFPLYTPDWSAEEDLLLLEAVALCGLNWPEVAQHVGTKFSDDCKAHFFRVYVDSPSFPDPIDPLPETEIARLTPMPPSVPVVEKKAVIKTGLSMPIKNQFGTFMPLRHEFDSPFNEDAEEIPADIVFNEDDTEEERSIKIHALQVYSAMLSERRRKTDFLVGMDLLDWRQHQQFERTLVKDDAFLLSTMRPFLQCQPKAQWERLVNGVLLEQQLRREIAQYKSLREAGIRWLADASRVGGVGVNKTASGKRLKSSAVLDGRSMRSSAAGGKSGGVEPLSNVELDYCDAFNLGHDQYVIVKEALIRESLRSGGQLSKKDARLLSPLPPHQTDQLYGLFTAAGWLLKK